MSSFKPTPGDVTKLHVQLGFINTNATVTGTSITVNISDGFDFLSSDAPSQCVIMIMGAGASGAPFWTTISTVGSTSSATLAGSAPTSVSAVQAVLYRPLPYAHAHVLVGSITGSGSIRNFPTFDFTVYSDNGGFAPLAGMPVLVTHDDFGDQFGGFIEQAVVENMPGTSAIQTHCDAVSWDKRLSQRLLYLASSNSTSTLKEFVPDGSSRDYHLDAIPLTVTSIYLEGLISISGLDFTLIYGAQFYDVMGTHMIVGGVPYNVVYLSSTTGAFLGSAPAGSSGIAFKIPQTFDVQGASGTPQWFYNLTSNTVTQAFQGSGSNAGLLSETLIPFGGVFDMVAVQYTYQSQLSYESIAIDVLVETLIGLIANEGITTSITLASSPPTIAKIQYSNRDTIDSALQAIIQQVNDGTNNYWYRVSPRKVLVWDIIGVTVAAPFNISTSDGSDGNVLISIDNTITLEKFVNTSLVEIAAAQGANQLTQNITGGSPQRRSWTVSSPIATTPLITRYTWNGSNAYVPFVQSVGLLNDPVTGSGQQWYWSPGSNVITQDPVIGFALGFTTGSASLPEYLAVTYFPQVSLIQSYVDAASVSERIAIEGGSGEHDAYLTPGSLANITGSANANYAQAIVAAYNSLSQEVKVVTYRGGLAPAQYLTLTIAELGISGTYVVDQVVITDSDTVTKWEANLVVGAVIGDWKTAWRSIAGGEVGLSGVGSQTQGTGTTPGGGGGSGGGAGAGLTAFISLLVTTSWSNVNDGELDLLLSVVPPTDPGTTIGGHVYLEIPDVSTTSSFTVGSSTVGSTNPTGGLWSPIDVGQYAYNVNQQPWVVKLPSALDILWPDGTPTVTPIRVYVQAYSALADPPPIQANQLNPTLNEVINIVPQTSTKPGSGSSVTGIQPNTISAVVDSPITVGGQMQTPILVTVTPPSPVPDAWAFEVYAYIDGDLTSAPIFQSAPYRADQAGDLLSDGSDGIAEPHTFAPITPTQVTSVTLFAVSGLIRGGAPIRNAGASVRSSTVFIPNEIIPGITPSCVISIGTGSGTLDPTQHIQALLDASMGIVSGLFGITTGGVTNSKLSSNAVGTSNIQSGAVTSPEIGAFAVAAGQIAAAAVALANMQSNSVGTAQLNGAIITTANIGSQQVTTALIATAAITTALINNLAVTDAKINDLSASKITAGTISASVSMTSPSLTITAGGTTINLDSSNQLKITASSYFQQVGTGISTVVGTENGFYVSSSSTGVYCTLGSVNGLVVATGSGFSGAYSQVTSSEVQVVSGVNSAVMGINSIQIGGFAVLKTRQTGPGTPSFATLSDAQTWCQNLYNALKAAGGHGLVN